MTHKTESIQLTGQQRALYKVLVEKDEILAGMYSGALMVLDQKQNPDRIALAAHGIRELVEKVPIHFGVERKAQGESLKNKALTLQDSWEKARQRSQCYQDGVWAGGIDGVLATFLGRCVSFFEWMDKHMPRRKQEFTNALRAIDASGRPLPETLEALTVRLWETKKEFFQAVAHHGKRPEQDEFLRWLDALERFLLDRLCPRTFADLDVLDQIIQEGEGNG